MVQLTGAGHRFYGKLKSTPPADRLRDGRGHSCFVLLSQVFKFLKDYEAIKKNLPRLFEGVPYTTKAYGFP